MKSCVIASLCQDEYDEMVLFLFLLRQRHDPLMSMYFFFLNDKSMGFGSRIYDFSVRVPHGILM